MTAMAGGALATLVKRVPPCLLSTATKTLPIRASMPRSLLKGRRARGGRLEGKKTEVNQTPPGSEFLGSALGVSHLIIIIIPPLGSARHPTGRPQAPNAATVAS